MAKVAVSENSLKVLNYLKEHSEENLTAQDIADALGYEKKSSVDGIVTAGLAKKGYAKRVTAQIEDGDDVKNIKFIKITESGMNYDHKAAKKADADAEIGE